MFLGLEKRNPNHFCGAPVQKIQARQRKNLEKYPDFLWSQTCPFDIGQLREIMSYDEMELDCMGDKKTTTFFIISDTNTTYNFIVALAFSQMFNLLCERADSKYGGRLPHHVRVLWDEAANTGQVPPLLWLLAWALPYGALSTFWKVMAPTIRARMGRVHKEASTNSKNEIDSQQSK